MDNKLRKRTIIIELFKTLLIDIFFGTISLGVITYYIFYFFFNDIYLSFYDSLFYSFFFFLFLEWIYFRKYIIDDIKLDLDVADLHNKLEYTDLNEIIKEQINLIELDINNIKLETRNKNDDYKVFQIPLGLNIKKLFSKHEVLVALKEILTINEKQFIVIDINGMIEFLSKSYNFMTLIEDSSKSKNNELMKNNRDDSYLDLSLATNDEEKQTILNYVNCLRHKFISIIIQEYTNLSSFSPVTGYYYQKLMKYEYYCSIKDKLDFSKDIFQIIANELEFLYLDEFKEKTLLHQLHKLFSGALLSNEILLQEKFCKIITINYLYLLSEKRTLSNYFLDRLYSEALASNGVDINFLHEVRRDFSKYLYKKPFQENLNNGQSHWSSIIKQENKENK